MQKRTKDAFIWITTILKKNKVPFQISGGFAAKIYGSKRPLADIDIDVSNKHIDQIIPDVKKYIIYGPKQYVDENWNLFMMTLKYRGQEIDICGKDNRKIFDYKNRKWIKNKSNLKKGIIKNIYGISVNIIPINDLIDYKKKLLRRVDKIDIKYLQLCE